MKGFLLTFGLVLALQFFVVAGVASAAGSTTGGIVQLSGCTGPDCTACNAVDMLNGFIKWLIGIMFILCAVLITVAGVRLVTSGGNSHTLDEAKGMLTNAIIGMLIILAAWMIIDTVIRGLVGQDGKLATNGDVSGWLYWSQVQCQVVRTPVFDESHIYNLEYSSDFPTSGSNSYQAYVYNAAKSCKTVSNASFPSIEMCQNALASVRSSGPTYVVQDCTGKATKDAIPTWNNAAICGGGIDGPIGTGNTAIVAYAEQMRQKNCIYSQPQRNGCTGSPGYTDCSNLVNISYTAAGCSSPGQSTADQIFKAVSIGNPADLRPGDALIYRSGGDGHVVICRDVGCNTIIAAAGVGKNIIIGNGSYYYNNSIYRVIRASSLCH